MTETYGDRATVTLTGDIGHLFSMGSVNVDAATGRIGFIERIGLEAQLRMPPVPLHHAQNGVLEILLPNRFRRSFVSIDTQFELRLHGLLCILRDREPGRRDRAFPSERRLVRSSWEHIVSVLLEVNQHLV